MSELHGLFAACENDHYFEVGRPLEGIGPAVARWYRFDNPRYRGREQRIRGHRVKYWAVRSKADPDSRWSGAIPVRCSDVWLKSDAYHNLSCFFNKTWRATAKHSTVLTADGDCVIGYGINPLLAASDARSQARRRGLI